MAGSRGGKHSKGKGKSKSNKSDTINHKPKVSNCKLDRGETSSIRPDVPSDPKDKNPHVHTSSPLSTCRFSYTENELEDFLNVKVEALYTKAKEQLLILGYSMEEVETAILRAGYSQGPMDLLYNVLKNSAVYLDTRVQPKTEAFEDMNALCRSMAETMINSTIETYKGIPRSDAVWYLLNIKWDRFPSTMTSSHLQSGNRSILACEFNGNSSLVENEDTGAIDLSSAEKDLSGSQVDSSFKKVRIFERINLTPALVSYLRQRVLILTNIIEKTIEDPVMRQQASPSAHRKPTEVADIVSSDYLRTIAGCFDDPSATHIVDLIENIIELQEKVKEQKEWAQKKVIDSATRLSKDFLELKMLRLEKVDKEKIEKEKIYAEKLCILRLMEAEQAVRKANSEARSLTNTVITLQGQNAEMRADIEAIKLNASEYDKELIDVLKRVRRCRKKLDEYEKQASIFHSQIQDEKQRVAQLEEELLQAEKEADKAEEKWRKEVKEKERMCSCLAEEIRMAKTHKANSEAHLSNLKQKVEIDSQLARDELQRLEDELSRLQMSSKMTEMSLEDHVDFWLKNMEASSSSVAPVESSEKGVEHLICMMCSENEVSVVFLPCRHQVLCSTCYSENFETEGGQCPYCRERIEESIRVYGLSS